jgi:hypothetical protein
MKIERLVLWLVKWQVGRSKVSTFNLSKESRKVGSEERGIIQGVNL